MSIGPKQALFAEFAGVARALGNAHRLEILEHLGQGERSVEAVSRLARVSIANASQHLQQLKRAGLVTSRRQGKFVLYGLADASVLAVLGALQRVSERQVAGVDRIVRGYFHARDEMEPVTREDLLERSRGGLVTVLDVRPPDEFAMGHVPGAINIPLAEIEARLDEIPAGHEIVAYCRGAYCVLAFEAVATLRSRGFSARRLQDGLPQWKAAGLPIEMRAA